jgi:hypothetical protein
MALAEEHAQPVFGGLVVPSPPATMKTGAKGREIESRQGVCT